MACIRHLWCLALVATFLPGAAPLAGAGRLLHAAEVKARLKNKTELRGVATNLESMIVKPEKKVDPEKIANYPVVMMTTLLKRYFVPARQIDEINKDVDLSRHEGFNLQQTKMRGGGRKISAVQGYVEKPGPFNSKGQRTVILQMEAGPTEILQGVTHITPECLEIIALNYTWKTAVATSSVPVDVLDGMLRQVTRQDHADDRLKIARFYIQAGLYQPAQRELEAIRRELPRLAKTVDEVNVTLMQAVAQEILGELKLRRAAGQHQFVYEASKKFPVEHVSAPILREVREITADYEQARDRAEAALAELGELQSQLQDDPRVKEIAPLRAELAEKLNYSSLERLDAYLKLRGDSQLKPEEKLALALSGWVVGSANAETGIDQTLRLWQARFLVLDYLRTAVDAETERKTILEKLQALEGIGTERIAQMIPLLPPDHDPPGAVPGRAVRIEFARTKDGPPAAYWVSLPMEHHLGHLYPLIVALHGEHGTAQQELQGFWAGTDQAPGQSQRHGYIVIAPEYVDQANRKTYDYNSESHQIVIESLRDARHRFRVDSDRVFLSGHGMGGDAAWDMGFAHPHLFAGVIPITGAIDRYAKYDFENGRVLPMYAVCGEFDRDLFARSGTTVMKMMQQNFDLIYTEYKGAGPDSFYSEIHSLFDWMSKQRRPPPPKEVNARTLRETDNRFFWLEFSGIPEKFKDVDWTKEKQGGVKAMPVSASITPGNSLRVTSGAAHHRLWLPRGDGLINFEKRLKVDINGRNRFNDFVKPDMTAMLEHVRLTGDRHQLYWAMLEF